MVGAHVERPVPGLNVPLTTSPAFWSNASPSPSHTVRSPFAATTGLMAIAPTPRNPSVSVIGVQLG